MKISVNIPVYNVASFLPRCLDSVYAAVNEVEKRGGGGERNVEIICVDDGSTDGSGEILDEYKEKVERRGEGGQWKIIHQKNAGTAAAREAALRASTGDWIVSVDPDDWVEPDFLVNLLRAAESSDADLVWSDYRTDYGDGRPSEVSHECAGDDLDAYFLGVLGGAHSGVQWNKLIRRVFVMQNNIHHPDGRIPVCEDLWFTAAVLSCRPRIRFAPHADYHYCIRRGGATQSAYTHERFAGFVRLQEFLEGLVLPEGASEILRKRRKGLKFGVYRSVAVSDDEFYRLYPEVRDLWDYDTSIRHKVLFWFAVRGFRPIINRLWR
ncbi:MAG: glycosyltransferase [bacterium]|nr:glycosyltransferase [Candidatus Colisoma equi]